MPLQGYANSKPLAQPFRWFAAGCVAACLVHLDSLRPLIAKWLMFDQSMGHALVLFLVICGWLWAGRERFDRLARAPSRRGVGMIGLAALAWFLAALGDIELLEQLVMIAMFYSLAVLVAGWRSAVSIAPQLAMLLFCVPIWDELNDQLVDLSALMVGGFFSFTPITSHVAGNAITLPAGTVVIADGCSGLRYLIVGLAMANLASSMNRLRFRHQVIANLLALGLMLAVNWVRIIVIVFVAYYTDMQGHLVRHHENFGWMVFGVALLPLLLYTRHAPHRPEGE